MKQPEYKASRVSMAGYPCVEHVANPEDIKLFGEAGWIWMGADGKYNAVVTSPLLINRYWPSSTYTYPTGSELRVSFDRSELGLMIRRLRVPKSQDEQIRLSNRLDSLKLGSANA
jgi:hypothetical protein